MVQQLKILKGIVPGWATVLWTLSRPSGKNHIAQYDLMWLVKSMWENEDVKFRLKWKEDANENLKC